MISPGDGEPETGIATLLGEKSLKTTLKQRLRGNTCIPRARVSRRTVATVTRIVAYLGVLADDRSHIPADYHAAGADSDESTQ